MDSLPNDDNLFSDIACVTALLRYGIQFPPKFVTFLNDTKYIAAVFPLMRDHDNYWISTFLELIMEKRFDDIRSLLQVPAFIRVIRRQRKDFGDGILCYRRGIDNWGNDIQSIIVEVMQQPFFEEFVNYVPEQSIPLLQVAFCCQNIEMIKALTSHNALDFSGIWMAEFIDNQYVDLIKGLLTVEDKSPKMKELLRLIYQSALRYRFQGRLVVALFENSGRQRLVRRTKMILSRLFWPFVACRNA